MVSLNNCVRLDHTAGYYTDFPIDMWESLIIFPALMLMVGALEMSLQKDVDFVEGEEVFVLGITFGKVF